LSDKVMLVYSIVLLFSERPFGVRGRKWLKTRYCWTDFNEILYWWRI